jgi:hypothetical protein
MKHHDEHLLQQITTRAATDLPFRRGLLTQPERTIRDAYGIVFPEGFRIYFVEKPEDVDIVVVLPEVARPDGELDDDELDAVAGGTNCALSDSW